MSILGPHLKLSPAPQVLHHIRFLLHITNGSTYDLEFGSFLSSSLQDVFRLASGLPLVRTRQDL